MKLVFARRALPEIERCARWWVEHRVARGVFAEELAHALDQIRNDPKVGPIHRVVGDREQRRVLMPKTAHHVYYRVGPEEIYVLSVWGARRGRGPLVR